MRLLQERFRLRSGGLPLPACVSIAGIALPGTGHFSRAQLLSLLHRRGPIEEFAGAIGTIHRQFAESTHDRSTHAVCPPSTNAISPPRQRVGHS